MTVITAACYSAKNTEWRIKKNSLKAMKAKVDKDIK